MAAVILIHDSTDISLFEVVIGVHPRLSIDLVLLPLKARPSVEADKFIKHMQRVHNEVWCYIAPSNDSYKTNVDKYRHLIDFSKGDMVIIQNYLEQLPPGANKKLHPHRAGPFKLSSNAYTLKLPLDLSVSPTFNVTDLTLYHGHDNNEDSKE